MTADRADDAAMLARAVERIESLLEALESSADRKARQAAREMLELLLDLHGLALARISAMLSEDEAGRATLAKLAANPHVGAMLLLHGLHPEDAVQRIGAAIERQRAYWRERAVEIELISADSSSARLRLSCKLDAAVAQDLQREIEDALIDAAPELDEVVIEIAPGAEIVMA